jgi:hypothetical protein
MLPTSGLKLHLTAVFVVLRMAALNWAVCSGPKETEAGLSEMATAGINEMVALADFVGSAKLVAFTMMDWPTEILAGAVYKPFTSVPTEGARLQLTPTFGVLATKAVKLAVCRGPRITEEGLRETLTAGISEMVALADFVGSAKLVAFTITGWAAEIFAGAVYKPFTMLPTDGAKLQVTPRLGVFATAAVKFAV